MITHNLEIAKTADRVIVIEDGKIIRRDRHGYFHYEKTDNP